MEMQFKNSNSYRQNTVQEFSITAEFLAMKVTYITFTVYVWAQDFEPLFTIKK